MGHFLAVTCAVGRGVGVHVVNFKSSIFTKPHKYGLLGWGTLVYGILLLLGFLIEGFKFNSYSLLLSLNKVYYY